MNATIQKIYLDLTLNSKGWHVKELFEAFAEKFLISKKDLKTFSKID